MTKKTSQAKQKPGPAVVLFGMDQGEKPRAAAFEALQAKAAAKLANTMSLRVLKITTPEQAAVAAQLPAGRLYVTGKGFVPYIRQELYAKVTGLVAAAKPARTNGAAKGAATPANGDKASAPANHAEASSEATVGTGQNDHQAQSGPLAGPAQPTITGFPSSWTEIEVGHLVVAQESLEDGWWEAIVLERQDDLFTLRWRDYPTPKYPTFVRHRSSLALICPMIG